MLVIVAVIHLLPLSGALGSERLAALYGLPINEPNLVILMRHRAVLFGILGFFFLFAAFRPAYQAVALMIAFLSVVSFLWLTASTGGYNVQIARVFKADIVALLCIIIGIGAHIHLNKRR